MAGKLDKERDAIAAAERELAERRSRLAEMEREEQEKELQRLVKKLSVDTAITILTKAVDLTPKAALEALTSKESKPVEQTKGESQLEPA